MNSITKHLEGFNQSDYLWLDGSFLRLKQIPIEYSLTELDDNNLPDRLGKRTEAFLKLQLEADDNYEVLANGVQIIDNKQTLGEIDLLLHDKSLNRHIHVEASYKIYLYIPDETKHPLACWEGPNRKDSLLEKVEKIHEKQFPILRHPATGGKLAELNLEQFHYEQLVHFVGQLYLPYNQTIEGHFLNPNAVEGYWLSLETFNAEEFKNDNYHIPSKIDWLDFSYENIEWQSFDSIQKIIQEKHLTEQSPLIIRKKADGTIKRLFVTFY